MVLIHLFAKETAAARILPVLMAAQAGLPILDFSAMAGDGQGRYFRAITVAWSKGDYAPLSAIFEKIVLASLEAHGLRKTTSPGFAYETLRRARSSKGRSMPSAADEDFADCKIIAARLFGSRKYLLEVVTLSKAMRTFHDRVNRLTMADRRFGRGSTRQMRLS